MFLIYLQKLALYYSEIYIGYVSNTDGHYNHLLMYMTEEFSSATYSMYKVKKPMNRYLVIVVQKHKF